MTATVTGYGEVMPTSRLVRIRTFDPRRQEHSARIIWPVGRPLSERADAMSDELFGLAEGHSCRHYTRRTIASLRAMGRVPDVGPVAELADDLLALAALLDRAYIGPKPAWHGARTNSQASTLLQRAYDAISGELRGLDTYDWRNDSEVTALLGYLRSRGGVTAASARTSDR